MAKVGRPTKYDPKLCEEIINFFDIAPYYERKITTTGKNDYCKEETIDVANDLPHLITFARHIGVSIDTLNEWTRKHPEFSEALKTAKAINERMLAVNALKGLYQSTFSIFMAKNKFGWRDEQHLKGEGFETKQIVQVMLPLIDDTNSTNNNQVDASSGSTNRISSE